MAKDGRPRILVAVLHGLGDNIMATPAVRALRKKFPKAYIAIMGLKTLPTSYIWKGNPYVDDYFDSLISYNPRWWNPFAYFLVDYWKIMKELGAIKRIKHFDKVYVVKMLLDRRFKSHKIIRIAKELNVNLTSYKTDFFLTKKDFAEADKVLRKYKLRKGKFVCLHRVASDYDRKSWKLEYAQGVCDTVKEKVLVFNSEKSYKIEGKKEGKHLQGKNVINYVSKDLRTSAAILKRSKMLVGIDSIMSHLAGALGIPAVIMFRGANPRKYAPIESKRYKIITSNFGAENILGEMNEIQKTKV